MLSQAKMDSLVRVKEGGFERPLLAGLSLPD